MLDRPTLKRPRPENGDTPSSQHVVTQARPPEERFVLRVDGQAKYSFKDEAAARRRAQEIKKSFPVVMVTVLDSREGSSELVDPK